MFNYQGSVSSSYDAEQIYFIKEKKFLYIGITQRIVTLRWGAHFSDQGSFRKAIEKVDPDYTPGSCQTFFYLYNISEKLRHLHKLLIRRTLQHIEHEIHLEAGRRIILGVKHRVISDTLRTAPISSGLSEDFIHSLSKNICDDLEARIDL